MAETPNAPAAVILGSRPSERVAEEAHVFGLSASERLRRSLLALGVSRIDRIGPSESPPTTVGACVVLRDDYFYDARLLAGLVAARDCVLIAPDGTAIAASASGPLLGTAVARIVGSGTASAEGRAGDPDAIGTFALREVGVLDLASAYDATLRRSSPPYVHRARDADLRSTEDQIFAASYKGLTDLVTKWVFPVPARAVVRVLAKRGVKPNTVTAWSYVLAITVTWLFAEGWFASGLALGWMMTFLDTVDGKLARCTLTSSRLGNIADKSLDLVHPPFWWAAFAWGLPGGLEGNALACSVVVGGYLLGRALEGLFMASFEMEVFLWRPFDGFFRQIIARRNPNLILLSLGVLLHHPAAGYAAVAVWTAVCIGVAAERNARAFALRGRGTPIRPWME